MKVIFIPELRTGRGSVFRCFDNIVSVLRVLPMAVLLACGLAAAHAAEIGHPTFLSPHSSPIALAGERLFVANTPADTVDVIDVSSLTVVARIDVGVDPVAVAARPDGREVWVSNHVSDSVSVIDNDDASPTWLQVIATVQDFNPVTRATRFDEPVGIAFAGNDKAYVALSSENQVAVIDVASRRVVGNLTIPAQDPRAIRVRGNRLYVIPFESNNQTQISGCVGRIDNDLCTFDAVEHVVDNNNVLSLDAVVDIVRNPKVPDRDLFVFDTDSDQLLEVVNSVGTLLYGLAVDSRGRVFVSQTDARNDANGRAGTLGDGLGEMENRAFLNRITAIDCSTGACAEPRHFDLEPLPPANPAPGMALATPFAIQVSDDDATLVVTAAGSNKLFTVDASSGQVLGRADVGSVPRAIALESNETGGTARAWVLNAVGNSVSVVDLADRNGPLVTDTISLDDPTHPEVKRGRMVFNDAKISTTRTFSCESCHPDGGTDQLVWVLDTPICSVAGCNQIPPRVTMTIRGLRDTAPYHWDGIPGDPYGGINTANIRGSDQPNCSLEKPESCTRVLVDGSLASTMCDVNLCPLNEEGKDGALDKAQRDDMAKFLLSVPFPPAQRRSYTNVLSQRARDGFSLFHIEGDLQGDPEPFVCGDCHRMPFWVSTNTPGTGMEAPTWRGAYDRWLILPQGRVNLIDFDFYRSLAELGSPERDVWRLSWVSKPRFDPVWDMVLEGGTGFPGSFARNLTLNGDSADAALTGDLLDALEESAAEGAVLLQGEGVFIENGDDGPAATPVKLQYDYRVKGGAYIDREDDSAYFTRPELLSMASQNQFVGTFTARLGARVDVDFPQPAIWSPGPMEKQRGRQFFPNLTGDNTTLMLSGRHILDGARVFVDGRRVPATVSCQDGELPGCIDEKIKIQLAARPLPEGMHFLQVQNPDGMVSNDFIIHTKDLVVDNCPDIPNPDQRDSDGDGVGDRCDDDAFNFTINAGISGSWFDPAHDGEGWFVQLLDEQRAVVYWFTYTPPGSGGEGAQAWIGGVGKITGSSIVVPADAAVITSGPPFGPDFDPARVKRHLWGKFVLSFSGCNEGVMYYRSNDPDYGNGSMELKRLTRIGELDCDMLAGGAGPPRTTADFPVTPALAGAWYDPSHDGEGWLLDILADGRAVLVWFSYDAQGRQAWFLNAGTVADNRIDFDLVIPSGTDFGPTFKPEAVERPFWGKASFVFDDCNSGVMNYESSLDGYGSGSQKLIRLTGLWGHECH